MRRHQVLTGAVNPGSHCFSVGSIASFTFWAYGSGCDLVILGVDLQPIHIIPGHIRGYRLVTSLDCCQFCGKIAVSYGKEIVIYRPKLIENEKDGVPVFTWLEEAVLQLDDEHGKATVLSWASTGERLLVGCKEILLWEAKKSQEHRPAFKVQFSIDETEEDQEEGLNLNSQPTVENLEVTWELIWSSGIQEDPCHVQFSPDDLLFASVSKGDTMIKVWHQRFSIPVRLFNEDVHSNKTNRDSPRMDPKPPPASIDFTFTYLIHPKPVAGFQWRKGAPLLPSGLVPNILISSCHDNMCRIWCETMTPQKDITKYAAAYRTVNKPHNAKKRHTHHKSEKHLGNLVDVKKSTSAPAIGSLHDAVPDSILSDTASKRLFQHFHIAATINPTADIPLLPSMSVVNGHSDNDSEDSCDERESSVFTVHWLDNKHHYAMAHLNELLHQTLVESKRYHTDLKQDEDEDDSSTRSRSNSYASQSSRNKSNGSPHKRPSAFPNNLPVWDCSKRESVEAYLSCLASPISPDIQTSQGLQLPSHIYDSIKQTWVEQSDALFAIHPADGSLLVWHVSYMDENQCGKIRQAQVSFSSRIPMAIPVRDASTLCPNLVLYANHYVEHLPLPTDDTFGGTLLQKLEEPQSTEKFDQELLKANANVMPTICLLTKHGDGSLNHWEISFSANAAYSTISSICHKARFCGHRYHLSDIYCHPTLPLLLTTSHHKEVATLGSGQQSKLKVNSELILWRVDPIGALNHTGGVTELTRMNGLNTDDFYKISWFPILLPSWSLGQANSSASSCFLSLHKSTLHIYQAVIDAEELLEGWEMNSKASPSHTSDVGYIASRQSSSHPGCVILLEVLPLGDSFDMAENEILLLTVIPESQFKGKVEKPVDEDVDDGNFGRRGRSLYETFYVVLVYKQKSTLNSTALTKMWKIVFSANMNAVIGAKSHRVIMTISSDSSDQDSDTDTNPGDDSQSAKKRLSYIDVVTTELTSQPLEHSPVDDVNLVCVTVDPLLCSVFEYSEPLPYTLLTASKNGNIYFWVGEEGNSGGNSEIAWRRYQNEASDCKLEINVTGTPLVMKMAHCSMLACLHESKESYYVSVYESMSTGGSVWRLQDKIHIEDAKNTAVEKVHLDWLYQEDGTFLLTINVGRKVKIYTQCPVGMRWEDMAESNVVKSEQHEKAKPSIRPLLKRKSTLDVMMHQRMLGSTKRIGESDGNDKCHFEYLLCWSLLSEVAIGNSVGLSAGCNTMNPKPVTVSWVRGGLLLVAMDTEMHIFCQWVEQEDKTEPSAVNSGGVLYGSASLSQSTPGGLCRYLLHEGISSLSAESPMVNMMSVADALTPCLPQYHPLVLSELTNGGHLEMVKHILINLAVAINRQFESVEGYVQMEPLRLEKFDLIGEEGDPDDECKCLAPVLLYNILDENGRINDKMSSNSQPQRDATRSKSTSKQQSALSPTQPTKTDYNDLFSTNTVENDEEELQLFAEEKVNTRSNEIIDLSQFDPGYLGPEHCQVLHNYLAHNLLPGLSSLNQMELLAIADTISNEVHVTKVFDKSSAPNAGIATDDSGRGYASSGNKSTESMDECGVRFVFAMHNHICLLRALPAAQRTKMLTQGLGSCHFAWAFHSESEEEMLSLISSVQRGAPDWNELRSFGAGWWIRSTATLRRLIEQTARAAFQKDNSPLDAAVFYMALNKKNVLKGLFKSVHEDRMMQFFSQDFTEDRWHRAALKNAFALMGKQRFQEAVAFFLLANSVIDAVEVCIDKMRDLQLASVIVRLFDQEKSHQAHTQFLRKHVTGDPDNSGCVHSDPFLRSMAYWQLGMYENALKTLLDSDDSDTKHGMDVTINITDVYNFYNFLRTHPLILRQRKIDQLQTFTGADQEYDDRISMEERSLFFATAATHLEAGCPLLTLDVLSSLPPLKEEYMPNCKGKRESENTEEETAGFQPPTFNSSQEIETAADADWSTSAFDSNVKDELDLDWSESEEESEESSNEVKNQPVPTLAVPVRALKSPAKKQEDVPKKQNKLYSDVFAHQLRLIACSKIFISELKAIAALKNDEGAQIRNRLYSWLEKETKVLQRISPNSQEQVTSMKAPQFPDNLKVEKSEFSTDTESEDDNLLKPPNKKDADSTGPCIPPVPSLHELYLAEKQDWKSRRDDLNHRRRWLRKHRRFLRSLLSYCGLHEDSGGSLSPIRMEILFLLQDSLQEKSPHQLSSPVPNLTTVPLLSSSVAACHTVVAEPMAQISNMAYDILQTVLSYAEPPPYLLKAGMQSPSITLCRQAEALSACVYQSLCDINSKNYRARLLDKNCSPEVQESLRKSSIANMCTRYMPPTTLPSQWPGVVSLQTLLRSESNDDRPRLIVLLCESLVAVYTSLLIHGMQTCNALLLYRLVSNSPNQKSWNAVFGGGARIAVKYVRPAADSPRFSRQVFRPPGSPSHSIDGNKMRERLNRKALSYSHERQSSVTSTDSLSYREKFVAPEMTLWDMFLSKPLMSYVGSEDADFESDSDRDSDSVYSDTDDAGGFADLKSTPKLTEEGNPESYSWHILRVAIVHTMLNNIKSFLSMTGLEVSELGISSPILNNILQLLGQWQVSLVEELEAFPDPPTDFIKGINTIATPLKGRPAILKHQAMLDPGNTPFSGSSVEALGARRLWHCLIHKESIQDLFIRYIFHTKSSKKNSDYDREDSKHSGPVVVQSGNRNKKSNKSKKLETRRATIAVMSSNDLVKAHRQYLEDAGNVMGNSHTNIGKVKVLHKETEIVSSFCRNNANPTCVVVASNRDIQEVDISSLLACDNWSWIEEDVSPNIVHDEALKFSNQKDEEFLVVTRRQSSFIAQSSTPISYMSMSAAASSGINGSLQTGQGATLLLRRSFANVRRMTSHPTLPYYLSGHHDGSVRMWEWGHPQQITLFRAAGQYPKVTNLHFSPLGNKICAVDIDGYMALWQVSSPRMPFLYHQCHDRSAADCCFVSSTSVLATTGLSSTNHNAAIWDTLLPPHSMLVKDFSVYEGVGGACITYSAQSRSLLIGGRDGKVSVFDMRKMDNPLTSFTAHDAPVKCISISPNDKLFVTGSVAGDVRVWDCNSHNLVYNLNNEHTRNSLFRNFGTGAMKVELAAPGNRLFSCGADGTLKLRVLPHNHDKDLDIGHTFDSQFQKVALQKQVIKLANAIRQQCLAY